MFRHSRATRRPCCLCLFGLLAAWSSAAASAASIRVLDDKLEEREVASVVLDASTISLVAPDGVTQQQPRESVLRLHFNPVKPSDEIAVLRLTDGQQIAGEMLGAADDGQALRWRHARLGEVKIPLERIAAIRTAQAPASVTLPTGGPVLASDSITLITGDKLQGFVEAFGDEHVALLLEGADVASPIPLERIATLRLANPAATPAADASRVALTDGSVLAAQGVTISPEGFGGRLVLGNTSAGIALDLVSSVELSESGRRLLPISSLGIEVAEGGAVFGVPTPPARIDDGWRLHAPMAVQLALPDGASLLRLTATRDLEGVDRTEQSWSDCIVVIRDSSGETVLDQRLHDKQPEAATVLQLKTGGRIEVVLDPGVNGPVLDRVLLTGVVLIDAN